ncbi:hypothetical protein SLA2020_386080 [Shorea laevis]
MVNAFCKQNTTDRWQLCQRISSLKLIIKGKIVFKRASKWWFSKEGIEFDDDTKLEADVVILATGYDGKKKLKAILPEPFRSLLEDPSGVVTLYSNVLGNHS